MPSSRPSHSSSPAPQPGAGILDEVLATQKETTLATFDPGKIVFDLLEAFSERARHIVVKRSGLDGKAPETLERLGRQYGITRERVRQIEMLTRKSSTERASGPILTPVQKLVTTVLLEHGEAMSEGAVMDELLGVQRGSVVAQRALRLLLSLLPDVVVLPAGDTTTAGWAINPHVAERIHGVIAAAKEVFAAVGRPLRFGDLSTKLLATPYGQEHTAVLTRPAMRSYLAMSTALARNPYGEWGLAEWQSVAPRGVRDKAYLVLAKAGAPLHFRNITEEINRRGFQGRRAYPQTVHNELIKDERFVLVGRGLYALATWGYRPGTVADVLAHILTDAGTPVERDELVTRVLKQRYVKRNTILISLQDKARFRRVGKSQYALAIAPTSP